MAAKADKSAEKKKTEKSVAPKASKGNRLPILWETVNTLSQLTITLTGLGVAVVSYLNGNNILTCALKGGAAMVSIGLILYVVYWMVARGSLDLMSSLYKEHQQEVQRKSAGISTMEFNG